MTETYYTQHREKMLEYQKEYNKKIPKYKKKNYENQYYNNVRKYKIHKSPESFTTIIEPANNNSLIVEF